MNHNYALSKLEEMGHEVDEFGILFQDTNDVNKFWKIFKKYLSLLRKEKLDYDFSNIIFFEDTKRILQSIKFDRNVDFSNCTFRNSIDFSNCTFWKKVNFRDSIFEDEAKFKDIKFYDSADFSEVFFKGDTYFTRCTFRNEVTFENSECDSIFDFSDVAFTSLYLDKSHFPHASYLRLEGWDSESHSRVPLNAKHFLSKETARIIKAHLEDEKNIIESNKYFVIEQDKFYQELSSIRDVGTKLVLRINKLISNHQTNWVQVTFSIAIYMLIVFIGYEYFTGWNTIKSGFYHSFNKAIELIDPLNMFKGDNSLYQNHQAIGFMVRITSLYLFWQFISAFRQNTRRK